MYLKSKYKEYKNMNFICNLCGEMFPHNNAIVYRMPDKNIGFTIEYLLCENCAKKLSETMKPFAKTIRATVFGDRSYNEDNSG